MRALAITALVLAGCGGSLSDNARTGLTVIRGTLGGLYGACQASPSHSGAWADICDRVEQAIPVANQLGAGSELPPEVANRKIEIVIHEGS